MIKILLDSKKYDTKPSKQDAARLTKSLLKTEVEISPQDAAIAIGENGQSFCPALMLDSNKARSRSNWASQMVFSLDFDNSGRDLIKPEEALAIYQKAQLSPFACYETFSSSANLPKFRLMFMLKNPVLDYDEAKFIVNGLASILADSDSLDAGVGRDLSRLFYGGKKLLHYEEVYLDVGSIPLPEYSTFSRIVSNPKKLDLNELTYAEVEDFKKLLKGVKKAIADPKCLHTEKPNRLQKGSRYMTLLHSVNWLMCKVPITLAEEDVFEIILPIINENSTEWYDVEWDVEEKLSKIYDWCYGHELSPTDRNKEKA